MNDFVFDDEKADREEFRRSRRVPSGRVYVHTRCGGETRVSGSDYTHICDPFWPCTSTYCCTCSGFAPLGEVRWVDTRESIAAYRRRLRSETPVLLQVWRYGLGFLIGGFFGAMFGLLVGLVTHVPLPKVGGYALVGGLIMGFVCYLLGTLILDRVFDIDYRRMR